MQNDYTIRVNFKGGLTSPETLHNILKVAKRNHIAVVRFGLRQQLFLHVRHTLAPRFQEDMTAIGVDFDVDVENHPNIVSSYAAEEVFKSGNWLNETKFKALFLAFDYKPKLKINLSDENQSFSPFFSGHLNFVASKTPDYWHFAVRIPKSNTVHSFSKLVPDTSVVAVCKTLELFFLNETNTPTIKQVWALIEQTVGTIPANQPLELPDFSLPYYEGFNRYGDKTWLGVYKREENFGIDFLMDICEMCKLAGVHEICITAWKSIIIKDIAESFRKDFSNLLAKYNINVRHAANELNWQVEDDSEDALSLKHELVKSFDKIDLRTFGLCFGIKTKPKTEVFAAIMVRRRYYNLGGVLPLFYVYDISYTKDFDPNGRTKIYFAEGITKQNLSEQLLRCVHLYNQQSAENRIVKVGMA